MIDISQWSVTAKLFVLITPFILTTSAFMMTAYTTLTKDYDVACSAITSNVYLESIKSAWGDGGFKWRWLVVCTISGYVGFPWLISCTGTIDTAELEAFPANLKRRLSVAFWLNLIGFTWLVFGWAFFNFK
ncbi:hypothetical protein [Pseudomonas sp. S31]|uniref:hypothetical protein n=1 Tax=Pseudomonas sp. S31 TaxID=1564473 RepID=UPI00191498EC|nr:hypothetical protein [Pseudomonas sp. S31]